MFHNMARDIKYTFHNTIILGKISNTFVLILYVKGYQMNMSHNTVI